VILILVLLGSIFYGVATVFEAAGVGAAGAVLLSLVYRKLSWKLLIQSLIETLKITGFVMLIACCAYFIVGVFMWLGCGQVIKDIILEMPMGRWGSFAAVMLTIFILGLFIDWIAIVMIVTPVIVPLTPLLGFNPLWFALMICINLQMSFLTPPFASAIFVCKGTSDPELGITTMDIIKGVLPFVVLIIIALGICILFPQILLWLPDKMIRSSW
jgi:tripartite ATP-independent transporter DctM subunit